MSALEQIRKRPAITIGIIGFALILFLFTGINGCDRLIGGDRDTAAKVDGEKIKYDELRQATENLSEQYKQNANGQAPDNNILAEQALRQLIDQKLIEKEIARLGIKITDAEISDLIYGPDALPYFTGMAQNYGFNNMTELYTFAKSGEQGAEMAQMIIDNAVNMLREGLPQQKFESLLGAINVNKLDAKAYYDANATTSNVYLARQDLNTIPDDQVEVTDDEVRALYNKEKGRFAINDEITVADYILVNIAPSTDDYVAVQKEVEALIPELIAQPGLEAIAGNYDFTSTTVKGTADDIADNQVKNNFDKIVENGVTLLSSGQTYTIAKLLNTNSQSTTAQVETLSFTAPVANPDSIVDLLKAGTDIAQITELAAAPAAEKNLISDPLAATYLAAETGAYTLVTDPQTGVPSIVRVTDKSAPVTVYEIAKISRPVEASAATYASALEQLTAYIAANPKGADFKDNATESNFNVLQTSVSPASLSVLGLPSSGNAAKWAIDSKKGAVSDVFTDDAHSYLLAMAVSDRFTDYVPVTDPTVANDLRSRLIAEKKAAKIVGELAGKATDVDGYAAIMKATPETISVNYGSDYVRGFIPGDAALLANVAHAKKGELVGPLATRNSVIVFTVTDRETSGREFDFDTDRRTVMQREVSRVSSNLANILRAGKKISYDVQRFYQNN